MKRSKEKPKAPPPLKEVDPDEIDGAVGGFIDFFDMGGMGMGIPGMGMGIPGLSMGFPGMGFPGMGMSGNGNLPPMPDLSNIQGGPNAMQTLDMLEKKIALMGRRAGNGTSRKRR